ncbi:MAG: hypothetical protein WDZ27_04745 [Waddliaceae bacterium]
MSIQCTRLFRHLPAFIFPTSKKIELQPQRLPFHSRFSSKNLSAYRFTRERNSNFHRSNLHLCLVTFASIVVTYDNEVEKEIKAFIQNQYFLALDENLDYVSDSQENLWHLSAKLSAKKSVWAFLKNHSCKGIDQKNSKGQTPLFVGIESCNPEAVQSLIECGASTEIVYHLDRKNLRELKLPIDTHFITVIGYTKALIQKYTSEYRMHLSSNHYARQMCCKNRIDYLNTILKILESS